METTALQTLTADACRRLHGRLWPNGLGFDQQGWEFSYSETSLDWCAVRRGNGDNRKRKFGRGATPEQARLDAKVKE